LELEVEKREEYLQRSSKGPHPERPEPELKPQGDLGAIWRSPKITITFPNSSPTPRDNERNGLSPSEGLLSRFALPVVLEALVEYDPE